MAACIAILYQSRMVQTDNPAWVHDKVKHSFALYAVPSICIMTYYIRPRVDSQVHLVIEYPSSCRQDRFQSPKIMAIVVSTATFSALSNGSIHLDTQGSSRPAVLVSETDPNNAKRVNVYLPDMFILFLSEPPRVNPHYETVRRESETWLSR